MGILNEAFAKVKEVIDRWHNHVDPETSLREAQVAFMAEVTKVVHELEDRVKAFSAPVTVQQLSAPVEIAPLIETAATEPVALAPEATTQSSLEASGAQSAADPADV